MTRSQIVLLALSIVVLLPLISRGVSAETCSLPEDIYPCSCDEKTSEISMTCVGGNVSEIDQVFFRQRGKKFAKVKISGVKNGRFSSLLFWDIQVKKLEITKCDLEGLSDTDQKPPFVGLETSLEELIVSDSIKGSNQLRNLDLSHLKILKVQELKDNNIFELGDDWFGNGPQSLSTLNIHRCYIDELGERAFHNLTNLEILWFDRNPFMEFKRSMLPKPALKLRSLSMEYSSLKTLPDDSFSEMPALKMIYLVENSIERMESSTWSSIWKNITILRLDDNPLQCDSHMEWMYPVKRPADLTGTCETHNKNLRDVIDSNKKQLMYKAHYLAH